jgi:hypothetical protein
MHAIAFRVLKDPRAAAQLRVFTRDAMASRFTICPNIGVE